MPNLQTSSFYRIMIPMKDLVLALDVGTQSVRALIIDSLGNILNSNKIDCNDNGTTADSYYRKIVDAIKASDKTLLERAGCVVMTTIRDSIVLLDKDYNPLSEVILWTDERKVKGDIKLPLWKNILFSIVGLKQTARMNYKATRYNWFSENDPQLLEKTDKYVLLSTYLNYRLTGELKDSVASQIGHIPFDSKKRCWAKRSISRCVFDIPLEKLAPLTEVGTVLGNVNIPGLLENVPLIAAGTDKGCEAVGMSVIEEGKAAVSLGTAATIAFCCKKYCTPKPFVPAYPAVIPECYNIETQIYRGFWTVKWFKDNFCKDIDQEVLDTYLDDVPSGCDGLLMTPLMAPGICNPFARGMFFGLNDKHTVKHMYKAVIEGLAFELYHNMKSMEKRARFKIKEIYAGGGGSISDRALQIFSNVFGLPVKRVQTHEVSSLGCAIVGFWYLGFFQSISQAAKTMVHDAAVFKPDCEKHKLYKELYIKIYRHLEKTNTCMFKKEYLMSNRKA